MDESGAKGFGCGAIIVMGGIFGFAINHEIKEYRKNSEQVVLENTERTVRYVKSRLLANATPITETVSEKRIDALTKMPVDTSYTDTVDYLVVANDIAKIKQANAYDEKALSAMNDLLQDAVVITEEVAIERIDANSQTQSNTRLDTAAYKFSAERLTN